jgi:pimeloyl-ACP methyl ester carboxylesterase
VTGFVNASMAEPVSPGAHREAVAASGWVTGTGPPVVYVHGGFAGLGRAIRDQTAADDWQRDLVTELRLASYRRRGCGLGFCPPDGYTLADQVEDLHAVLDRLGLTSVHLFGSSAGGPITIGFAAKYPGQVRSLIIQGSSLRILRPGDGVYDAAQAAWALLDKLGPEEAYARRPTGVETGFDEPWRRRAAELDGQLGTYLTDEARVRKAMARIPIRRRAAYYAAELRSMRAYEGIDVADWAAHVEAPSLVLHGENDHVLRTDSAVELGTALPRADVTIVPSGGHTPVFRVRQAREHLRAFVRSREAA